MHAYVVGARAPGTITTNRPIAALWNPSTAISLYVTGISWIAADDSGESLRLARITSRGTPGSTVTPDEHNALDSQEAPSSGALLDLSAYSAAPTVALPDIAVAIVANKRSSGIEVVLDGGIRVPPGTGLALITATGAGTPYDVTFAWSE